MTALTASKDRVYKEGKLLAFPLAVDIMYKGALMKVNAAGYLAPCAAEAGAKFAGVAYETVDNRAGSAGDVVGRVERVGAHIMQGTGFSQANVGAKVYASDDDTVSTTQATNEQEVGQIVEFISSTEVWVQIAPETL